MPIFKKANSNFFKKWSSEMAYVLGFFAADGCMIKNNRGAHFIEFHVTDKKLLENIKAVMGCDHKITEKKRRNWKIAYKLQIGSKEMFNDLLFLKMTPCKSLNLSLPNIPQNFFSHFVRGYFDGDGNVFVAKRRDRKTRRWIIQTHFTSGSMGFLKELRGKLKLYAGLRGGSLYKHQANTASLKFSINDSVKLFHYMYNNGGKSFLERKKDGFLKYINNLEL